MNKARMFHASCGFESIVYAFCGTSAFFKHLNSIERLDLVGGTRWETVFLSQDSDLLMPRTNPAVAVLNDKEIVIMGGA